MTRLNPDKVAKLNERAQHLIAIKESPSWPTLRGILEAQIDAKTTLLCGVSDLPEAKLHHLRGHVHGLRYVVEVVENGEKALEKAIQQARALAELEEEA